MDPDLLAVELQDLAAVVHHLDGGSRLQIHLVAVGALERAAEIAGDADRAPLADEPAR